MHNVGKLEKLEEATPLLDYDQQDPCYRYPKSFCYLLVQVINKST